ncbi:DUF3515 family protein [Arsenicicoccus dermatophilus]|uniref:DUF3515 family protein n=1 Tax=Arsenicicoccus dermatophilus TaxID=1076331 RepID=UPI001F4C72A5|nr:DUF3515 family protein [Arsenicicoccus dermatophilus]MCH8612939.1 DUF3515 domain-containing protein [Arsenicicoccus dermatophilus]
MAARVDRRMIVTATVCALAAVAVTLWLLHPRALQVAPATADGSAACARVAARWPDVVAGLTRRDDLRGGARAAAAWGEPAVIARCGVPALAPTTDQCVSADGVDWVVRDLSDGQRLTSYGTDPAVEVLVPRRYAPAPLRVGAFAPAVRTLPGNGHRCR